MNKLLKYIIDEQGSAILSAPHEWYQDVMEDMEVPCWDNLSPQDKLASIKYVVENTNDEDFGHSQCCQPVHQATAFFLAELWARDFDTENIFDDLDCVNA